MGEGRKGKRELESGSGETIRQSEEFKVFVITQRSCMLYRHKNMMEKERKREKKKAGSKGQKMQVQFFFVILPFIHQ